MSLRNPTRALAAALVLLTASALLAAPASAAKAFDFTRAPNVNTGFDPVVQNIANRPAMLIETNYYAYGPGTGFTDPQVILTVEANGNPGPVTLYVYWHDRVTGAQLFYNGVLGFTAVETDVFGVPGAPLQITLGDLDDFKLFGDDSAFGPLPNDIPVTTGRYQFVAEVRDSVGATTLARTNALYNWVDGVETHGGSLAVSERWRSNMLHYIESPLYVEEGATLTVDRGTMVAASTAGQGTLIIRQGAAIDAVGAPIDPIVFTSELEVGDRSPGAWGGMVINGLAPTNRGTDPLPEGEGDSGPYGGSDADDSSGRLSYVRLEFAGIRFSEQNELNGIAFQGVGRGTQIDHIQVHRNQDDGVEFFGGTADAKYLLMTGCHDDSLDWTDGWTGRVQYFAAVQFANDEQDQGIEADNLEDDQDALPRSSPDIRNATFIGDAITSAPLATDEGNLIRLGTQVTMNNAVIAHFTNFGVNIDGATSQSFLGGNGTSYDNVILFGNAGGASNRPLAQLGSNISTADPGFFNSPIGRDGGGVVPDLCFANGQQNGNPGSGAFFDRAPFIGAIDCGNSDWTQTGWTTWSDN